MQEMIDGEMRRAIGQLIQTDDVDLIETVALWCLCAAIVHQLAECDIVLPPEVQATVKETAAKLPKPR